MGEKLDWKKPHVHEIDKTSTAESVEFDERIRTRVAEQMDMRILFAEALQERMRLPAGDALRKYTDLHIRLLDKWPGDDERSDAEWTDFVARYEAAETHEQRVQLAVDIYLHHSQMRQDHVADTYWPFRYDYNENDRAIEIHFGKIRFEDDNEDGPGILSAERLDEQREKLRQMFTEIKERYAGANSPQIVRGASWLYNRESYRRLYPQSYTVDPTVRKGKFNGGGTWGQFTDKSGGVNPDTRARFMQNLAHLDPDSLEEVFPYKTLTVSAPIEEFYREYGIG